MLGRDGGDASDADVVLVAVLSEAVPDALTRVTGLDGKVVLDATNRMTAAPPTGYPSIAEYIKAQTGGPTAKVFNLNFGALLEQAAETSPKPGNIWVGDEGARPTRAATKYMGNEPLHGVPLEVASVRRLRCDADGNRPRPRRGAPLLPVCFSPEFLRRRRLCRQQRDPTEHGQDPELLDAT